MNRNSASLRHAASSRAESPLKPPRKEREREARRREILEAAEAVFARKGYHGATVGEIARESECSVGTIYNFFDGKEDLYARLVAKLAEEFFDDFEREVLPLEDPVEAIGALIELRLEHFDRHRGFARAFFEASPWSRIDPTPALPPRCEEMAERYTREVRRIFERGIARGAFDDVDPLFLALSLEGIIQAFALYFSTRKPAEPAKESAAKLKAVLLDRLRLPRPPARSRRARGRARRAVR